MSIEEERRKLFCGSPVVSSSLSRGKPFARGTHLAPAQIEHIACVPRPFVQRFMGEDRSHESLSRLLRPRRFPLLAGSIRSGRRRRAERHATCSLLSLAHLAPRLMLTGSRSIAGTASRWRSRGSRRCSVTLLAARNHLPHPHNTILSRASHVVAIVRELECPYCIAFRGRWRSLGLSRAVCMRGNGALGRRR